MSDDTAIGRRLHAQVERLFPLARSLTGDAVRETLQIVGEELPLAVTEVPSGAPILDWTVPPEWSVNEAWIEPAGGGPRIADYSQHPLHLVGYSRPFEGVLERAELDAHLHSLPDRPEAIPYRTGYWADNWGFCLQDAVRRALAPGSYRVRVDTALVAGSMTIGEITIPGSLEDTVLVSTHTCHPAMANDNCSGIAVAAELARWLLERPRRLTYRIVFCPGTVGSIAWLALNRERVGSIRHGIVLAGLGDPAPLTWKKSRRGDTTIDRVVAATLSRLAADAKVIDFYPYGYDERQYCSPGFDLAVGRLSRGLHGTYPEYHTSLDTPDFVRPEALAEALAVLREVVATLDVDRRWQNLAPHGEPQLGKRGLFGSLGALPNPGAAQMAMLWLLSQSDGTRGLWEIASRSGIAAEDLEATARVLEEHGLLRPLDS